MQDLPKDLSPLGLAPLPLVFPCPALMLPLPLPPLGPPLLPSRGKIATCSSFKLPLTAITLTIPGW